MPALWQYKTRQQQAPPRPSWRAGLRRLAVCIGLSAGLAACQDAAPPARLADVTGHLPDLEFSLTDDNGRAVNAAAYRGRVVLLYMGFTRCPDECPAAMARLTAVVEQTGAAGKDLRTLLATVDPTNDTPAVLHRYLASFAGAHPVGLAGDAAAMRELARRYRSIYAPAASADGMPMHGAAIYVFDRAGHARRMITATDPLDAVVADVRMLLADAAT